MGERSGLVVRVVGLVVSLGLVVACSSAGAAVDPTSSTVGEGVVSVSPSSVEVTSSAVASTADATVPVVTPVASSTTVTTVKPVSTVPRTTIRVPVTTQPATTVVPTTAGPVYPIFSECVAMDVGVPNGWRAELGVPALAVSGSLTASACAWSRHMAETGVFAHSGTGAEVIAASGNNPGCAWCSWHDSPGHFGVLTSPGATQIGCGRVRVDRNSFTYDIYSTCQLR